MANHIRVIRAAIQVVVDQEFPLLIWISPCRNGIFFGGRIV